MARRWVVLTAARGTLPIHTIVQYTEWAGRPAAADEVIYTDPVDLADDPIDGNWKVGGTVTRSGATYTFTDAPGQITPDDPATTVGQKRAFVRGAVDQLYRWDGRLVSGGIGQPSVIRALGHDLILGQLKALYLRSVPAAATVASIESYSQQVARGASDITNVPTFYRLAASLTKGTWVDGDPLEWATISGSVATRRTLQAAITAAPTDFRAAVRNFATIDLSNDAWIDSAITS